MLRFDRAIVEDLPQLAALLWNNGMKYEDPVEDYMLAWQDEEIAGCVRIEAYPDVAVVRPLVVAEPYRNRGIGRYLLQLVLPVGKPTVIAARGESVGFYRALGFTETEWQAIPIHQTNECISCPEREECRPQPMIHRS